MTVESGAVDNIQRTTKRHKKKDGSEVVEVIEREEGEVTSHTVDGQEQPIPLTPENATIYSTKFLESINVEMRINRQVSEKILIQLTEMNYYLSYLEQSSDPDSSIRKYFTERGYNLRDIQNGG